MQIEDALRGYLYSTAKLGCLLLPCVYIYIRNHMSTVYIFSCMKYGHEHNKTAALATLMLFTKLMLMFLYM